MSKFIFFLILVFAIFGCRNDNPNMKKETRVSDSIIFKSGLNRYNFKNGKTFDIINKNEKNSIYFEKFIDNIAGIICKNGNNQIVEYRFENNQMKYLTISYKNKEGLTSSPEVYWYSNYFLDLKNSVFITIEKIKEDDKNVNFKIRYNSGYRFKSGKIFFGRKMFSLKDSSQTIIFKMNNIEELISIPKIKISSREMDFSILIERSLGEEIKYSTTHVSRNQKSFFNLFVKEFAFNSPN